MADDQYTFTDPAKLYAHIHRRRSSTSPSRVSTPKLDPRRPTSARRATAAPVVDRRQPALITGGDSGIGAATAIAFAREGASVALSYLPEEEADAQRIAGIVREAGRPPSSRCRATCADPVLTARDLVAQTVSTASAGSTSS